MNSLIFAYLTLFSLVAGPSPRELDHAPAQAPLSGQQGKEAPRQPDPGELAEFRDEAEEGIKHVLISQVEAWNHGNLPGYMNGYWHWLCTETTVITRVFVQPEFLHINPASGLVPAPCVFLSIRPE